MFNPSKVMAKKSSVSREQCISLIDGVGTHRKASIPSWTMWSLYKLVSNQGMTPPHNRPAAAQTAAGFKTTATPAVLQADGLHFAYAGQALFANFSVRINPGVTLVRGGSGRGKSTLLRLLAGTLPLTAGQLHINGISLQDQPAAYRQQVFWTEPRTDAFDPITALEYFQLQRQNHVGFTDGHLAVLVDGLSLEPHLSKPLYMLSTGTKRKVWLAAAFASGVALTLLDEPFAALDTASIGFVMSMLEDAATHRARAWVLAHYEAPGQVPLACTIDLGD